MAAKEPISIARFPNVLLMGDTQTGFFFLSSFTCARKIPMRNQFVSARRRTFGNPPVDTGPFIATCLNCASELTLIIKIKKQKFGKLKN